MEQQRWPGPPSPASTGPTLAASAEHGSQDAEAWAATPSDVVTATGIVQARCGHATSGGLCGAWRLSGPGGGALEALLACGSVETPAAVQAAGADVAAAVTKARQAAAQPS